jgi:hypothetical protein
MCFSATVSYSTAAVLAATGAYALGRARALPPPYWLLALTPILFGIQQGFEGLVWQRLDAGRADAAVPYALGFHFFSHFLWLWWFPLCSYLLEPKRGRRRLFLGLGIFGALAGGLVFFAVLFHPEWMVVSVREHSIVYRIAATVRGPFSIPIPASALYALIVLVPLLGSSHRHLRRFGVLTFLSMALASLFYGYAFVSVWCLFAAALSLYLVYLIDRLQR